MAQRRGPLLGTSRRVGALLLVAHDLQRLARPAVEDAAREAPTVVLIRGLATLRHRVGRLGTQVARIRIIMVDGLGCRAGRVKQVGSDWIHSVDLWGLR